MGNVDPWLQLGASILNTGSQVYTNAKNRKWALQDWQMQNAYNSPAQQMQRYKEAGLNPNLIYKQTNEAGAVRTTDAIAPKLDPDALGILGKSNKLKLQDLSMQTAAAQLEQTQANIDKTRDEATYIRSNTDWRNLQNEIGRGTKETLMAKPAVELRQTEERIKNIQADTLLKADQLQTNSLTRDKLKEEINGITQSNRFIKSEKNTQLAVQKAMIKSMEIGNDLTRKKIVTENFTQEQTYSKVLETFRDTKEAKDNFEDIAPFLDKIITLGALFGGKGSKPRIKN
jgi:hypothetical protein